MLMQFGRLLSPINGLKSTFKASYTLTAKGSEDNIDVLLIHSEIYIFFPKKELATAIKAVRSSNIT
jgi:hypothetical protein